MAGAEKKNFDQPDERVELEGVAADVVQLGDASICAGARRVGGRRGTGARDQRSGVRSWLPDPQLGDRVLATLLFTDIVGSTEMAARLGDRAWRELLGRHDRSVRNVLDRHRGREVKTIGDGSTTRQLASGAGIAFEERGERELKGLGDPRMLYAVVR